MINKEKFVPENTIVVIPHFKNDDSYLQILQPLRGQVRRDWFGEGFYYCLPLTIGNQYGFIIKSIRSFSVEWHGGESTAIITINDGSSDRYQSVENVFGYGIVSIQNRFTLRTPPGINLMTIQPPNIFIPNMAAMTGGERFVSVSEKIMSMSLAETPVARAMPAANVVDNQPGDR